jgi:hypothetical protein
MIIIEAREVKRLSKKIKEHYYELKPGEFWYVSVKDGQRVSIIADKNNTKSLFAGRK